MIHPLLRVVLPLVLLALDGCAPQHHHIVLRDGREIVTASRPEFVAKTGYYRYRGMDGRDALVRADEVVRMSAQ